jgi:hypothetical protein
MYLEDKYEELAIKTHFDYKRPDNLIDNHPSFQLQPYLGLATKARACKGVGQEGSPRVTFHAFGSVGECEGMNPHTPK